MIGPQAVMRSRLEMRSSVPFAQTPSWLLSAWEQHSNALLGLQQKALYVNLMKPCDMIGQILHYSVSLRQINSSLRCALLEVAESSLIIIYEEQALDSHKENEARVGLKIQRSWVRYKKNALNRRVCTVHWLVLTSLLAEKSDVCNVSQRTPAACGENIAMTWILANTNKSKYQ